MQPKLTLLSDEIITRILDEAYELLMKPGIKVQNPEARELLAAAGVKINPETHVAQIPVHIVKKALESVPRKFFLYDYDGNPTVQYGGDKVHFDPGSSGCGQWSGATLPWPPPARRGSRQRLPEPKSSSGAWFSSRP